MECETVPALLEAALGYAARGWPVFPIIERTKAPHTDHGLLDASTNAATIQAWWRRWPKANVAIRTGPESGLAVVDIDVKSGGPETFDSLIEKHGKTPETPESLTGGGGRHLLFRYREGFRNSASRLGRGIDTRGIGGYIVVPPSVHESGKSYEWEASSHPDDVAPAELPDWLMPDTAPPVDVSQGDIDFTTTSGKADGSPAKVGARNNTAASLAGQYIHEGLSLHQVMRLLKGWNDTNPQPLAVSELERVAASVSRTHVNKNPGAIVPVVDEAVGGAAEEATGEAEPVEDNTEPAPMPRRLAFPTNLLSPPGLVGEICHWINSTAYMPQPILSLANTLAFFGAVIGRKVQTPRGLRSNLYILGVGASGCGKDHSRQCIKRICEAAGLIDHVLGGEDISSDAAVLGAVYEHPSLLFQLDEIGHFISNTTSKYSQSHQRAIAPLLTRLFTSANGKFLGKEYANRKDNKRRDIDQPNVCIYGTTVPDRLYEGLSPGEIADGFLGRMMVFQSDTPDPQEQDVELKDVPESIVTMVKAWHSRQDQEPPSGTGNLERAMGIYPRRVPFEADAMAEILQFRLRCKQYKSECRGSGLDPLWARGVEHATKIAMIVACGCEFSSPIVTGDVARWATRLVEHVIAALVAVVRDSVAGSDHEKNLLYVLRAIQKNGPRGISTTELTKKTQKLRSRDRNEILQQLIDSQRAIMKSKKSAKGVPARIYIANWD